MMIKLLNISLVLILLNIVSPGCVDVENLSDGKKDGQKSALSASNSRYRVAFIFAGALRSFVYPIVHETLRRNLLDAFCPSTTYATATAKHKMCSKDIFIRLSKIDNFHKGYNANGVPRVDKTLNEDIISRALLRLDPASASTSSNVHDNDASKNSGSTRLTEIGARQGHVYGHGVCRIQWRSIGSELLQREKSEAPFADPNRNKLTAVAHRVFRTLDSRRYDMYFNRWAAFQMALDEERRFSVNGSVKYDFMVHARLDAMWGEPVPSVDKWLVDRIWVPNSWYSEVPDTFALMHRRWADSYWSVDDLTKDGAMCLGGPNFDPKTLSPEHLYSAYGWTENSDEVSFVRKRECFTMFPSDIDNHDKKRDIHWSQAGASERILRRKLEHASPISISLRDKTLGYTSFFMAIVRRPFEAMCFYLHQTYLIGWIRHDQNATVAHYIGCSYMSDELRGIDSGLLGAPEHSVSVTRRYVKCSMRPTFLGSGDPLCQSQPGAEIHRGGIAGEAATWNFLPFQLRPIFTQTSTLTIMRHHQSEYRSNVTTMCLTAKMKNSGDSGSSDSRDLILESCLATSQHGDVSAWYDTSQLFIFHPLRQHPQPLRHYAVNKGGGVGARSMCLTVGHHDSISLEPCTNFQRRRKPLWDSTDSNHYGVRHSHQLFYVTVQERDRPSRRGSSVIVEWAADRTKCLKIDMEGGRSELGPKSALVVGLGSCSTKEDKKLFAMIATRSTTPLSQMPPTKKKTI
jgi:hypothetical protein